MVGSLVGVAEADWPFEDKACGLRPPASVAVDTPLFLFVTFTPDCNTLRVWLDDELPCPLMVVLFCPLEEVLPAFFLLEAVVVVDGVPVEVPDVVPAEEEFVCTAECTGSLPAPEPLEVVADAVPVVVVLDEEEFVCIEECTGRLLAPSEAAVLVVVIGAAVTPFAVDAVPVEEDFLCACMEGFPAAFKLLELEVVDDNPPVIVVVVVIGAVCCMEGNALLPESFTDAALVVTAVAPPANVTAPVDDELLRMGG